MQPPPFTVRIEHLPKPIEQPAKMPVLANPMPQQGGSAPSKPSVETMAAMNKTEDIPGIQQLPKHLRLTFAVYQGRNSFRGGEINHQLEIHGNRYTLRAARKSSGINSLRNTDLLVQTSRGSIGGHGLQPEIFEEENIARDGTQRQQATFDHEAHKLRFSSGGEAALPADAQDILSFMYQLSQLPVREEFFELPVIDGSQLQQYQIEIGIKEVISTPMGKLRAQHLRKIHRQGENYFEIWLGLEYRLLPVRFRQIDALGNVIEEILISDIRASDK